MPAGAGEKFIILVSSLPVSGLCTSNMASVSLILGFHACAHRWLSGRVPSPPTACHIPPSPPYAPYRRGGAAAARVAGSGSRVADVEVTKVLCGGPRRKQMASIAKLASASS